MNGNQIYAPDSWKSLEKGIVYHVIDNHSSCSHASLVFFIEENAYLHKILRAAFEDGLASKSILKCETQQALPPWLSKFEGVDIDGYLNSSDTNCEINTNNLKHLKKRLSHVLSITENIEQTLRNEDLNKKINDYAAECDPPQNVTRVRNWVLTYLAYWKNPAALLPNYSKCGNWDRNLLAQIKQGAPSISKGKNYGYKMTEDLSAQCVEAFEQFARNGRTFVDIYTDALRITFKCKTIGKGRDVKVVSEQPFPTRNQFKYAVDKVYGKETRQMILYGEARYRNSKAISVGRYSEEVSNLCEKIYCDAYQVDAKPRGYIENSVLAPLHGVTAADALSGIVLGIGFSFGSERAQGYRALLFCMAIDKQKFCSLFGIAIEKEEWPCKGIPPHILMDRGPGASKKFKKTEDFEKLIPVNQMAPSWSGQSKAPVENTHPKPIKLEGQPKHYVANASVAQMAKVEIFRILKYIKDTNVQDRLDPSRQHIDIFPTPLGIWESYDARYRNDSQQIPFNQAVRMFLEEIMFSIKDGRLYLMGRMYYSDEIAASGLFSANLTQVRGYILEVCHRFTWIEWKGEIFEVEVLFRSKFDEDEKYMSLPELKQFDANMTKNRSELLHLKDASRLELKERYVENIGVESHRAVKSVIGKSKKTALSIQESKEVFSGKNFNGRSDK